MRSNASPSRHAWFARRAVLAIALIGGATVLSPTATDAGPATPTEGCRVVPAAARAPSALPVPIEVSAVLSGRGELVGRQLGITPREGGSVVLRLPPEAFVAGPYGDGLLYGRHLPGSGSEVRAINLENGCDTLLARPDGAVRGVLPDAAGTALYVHTVNEANRRDGGVARIDLATGAARSLLEPFSDKAFGPIFATQLAHAVDGALAVQSCGFSACLTRVLEVDGSLVTFAAEHGPLVGVTASEIIAFAADHHRPTELLAIDRQSGARSTIAEEVYEAQLTLDSGAPRLLIDTPAGWQEVVR